MFAMSRRDIKDAYRCGEYHKRGLKACTSHHIQVDKLDELESDLLRRIEGIQNQIAMTIDKRNTIIQVNRTAKTALEVFDDILAKPKLNRNDLQLIIKKIKISENHIEVLLKSDIDVLFRSDEWEDSPAAAAMAPANIPLKVPEKPYEIQITQESDNHHGKIFSVKVISNGETTRMYIHREGAHHEDSDLHLGL